MQRILSLAAALAVGASMSAHAADLGGNCCADLEERVAELEAYAARKGNAKVSLRISGQVNKAILWIDTPDGSTSGIIDNPNSQSRLRVQGSAKINAKLSAGYVLELGFNEAASDQIKIRHSAIYLDGDIGRITIGQYSMAGDGAAESSLANTAVASTLLSLQPLAGLSPFDSPRAQVLRYDSPILGGFRASAAWVADGSDAWDVALRFGKELGEFRVAGAIAYRDEGDATSAFGSGSIIHVTTGLFVNAGAGRYEVDSTKLDAWHIQGGVENKISTIGKTTIFAEYGTADLADTKLGEAWGLGLVQSIDPAAMDLYVAGRAYDDDVVTVMGGARIKF